MALTIGITGGIGAGKSAVLQCLTSLGAEALEADRIAHCSYRRNTPLHQRLIERWGQGIVTENGEIDRREVAAIVFKDPDELQWLNQTVHPWVQQRIEEQAVGSAAKFIFCAVPLLYEAGWENRFHCVICVWCSVKTQHKRLRDRGWDNKEIELRLSRQLSMEQKAEKADFIIVNECSRRILMEQCRRLYKQLHR